MIIRFGAVVLFVGLSFATPSSAEILLQKSSLSLDLREGETQALDAVTATADPLAGVDAMTAQIEPVELPGPLAGLALAERQDEASQSAHAAESLALISDPEAEATSTAALSDRDTSEDFAWMTAQGSIAGEMTTGSIATTVEPANPHPSSWTTL